MFVYIPYREHSVLSYVFSVLWFVTENNSIFFFLLFFFFAEDLEMAYLLMFVILLHLITLAILFIATMEKVAIGFLTPNAYAERHVCCSVSLCLVSLLSPGGSGAVWRTQTCGTTAGSTTSQEAGCVRPPRKQVQEQDY